MIVCCKCHGEPARWQIARNRKAGGYWRCRVKAREQQRVENLSPEQIEKKRAFKRVGNMSPEQLEKKRAQDRVENMSPERLEKRRAHDRARKMAPEQLEKKRAQDRVENMSPEQIEKRRAYGRVENMSPEQIEKKRACGRVENMSPEQIEKKYTRERKRRDKRRLLRLLADRPYIIEMSFPKYVAIARLALGGSTSHERENARHVLDHLLTKEQKIWLSPLIINCAMRTTPLGASSRLCLESSQGD